MNAATYLYCLVRDSREPPLDTAPPGLAGFASPRTLAAVDDLWLVAADAPLPEYASETIQDRLSDLSWVSACALAHEAVVEHFASAAAVLPMKLFTLFSSDERALAHVRDNREELSRALDRVAGSVEWGVRVRLDETRAREILADEAREAASRSSAGTSFLLRKKLEQDATRSLAGRLRAEMEEVFAELSEGAAEAIRREPATPPEAGGRLLLDAAFLVPSQSRADFEALVERCASRLAPRGCEVTLTGPWPPYHFVEEAR
jgi:Gas vesicle synthesis protein GvpL/GvpF